MSLVAFALATQLALTDFSSQMESADKHKTQGAVLMAMAVQHLVPALIIGAIYADGAARCERSGRCMNEDFVTFPAVLGLTSIGVIFTAVGVPLYIRGANQAARLKIEPRLGGLALRF